MRKKSSFSYDLEENNCEWQKQVRKKGSLLDYKDYIIFRREYPSQYNLINIWNV
jgi:hypothetical protein